MTDENVEVVRAGFDQFSRVGHLREGSFDPQVELWNLRESPRPGPYRGYAGLRKWSDDIREVLDDEELTNLHGALRGPAFHDRLVDARRAHLSHGRIQ